MNKPRLQRKEKFLPEKIKESFVIFEIALILFSNIFVTFLVYFVTKEHRRCLFAYMYIYMVWFGFMAY